MKGQRRRKVEWRAEGVVLDRSAISHAYLSSEGSGTRSVCGLQLPDAWRTTRRNECPNCQLALKRLW